MEKEIRVLFTWKELESDLNDTAKGYEEFYPGLKISLDKDTLLKIQKINNSEYQCTAKEDDEHSLFMAALGEVAIDRFKILKSDKKIQKILQDKQVESEEYDKISFQIDHEEVIFIYYFDGETKSTPNDCLIRFKNFEKLLVAIEFLRHLGNPNIEVYQSGNVRYLFIADARKIPISELMGTDVTLYANVELDHLCFSGTLEDYIKSI